MLHLRIVAPSDSARKAVDLLTAAPTACNIIFLPGAAVEPEGDVILVDVAREDVSVILADLTELDIPVEGSIALEEIDTSISAKATKALEAARGTESDAVVWEEVEARTSETAELSASYLLFMVLAALIAVVGILLDTPILIIGAMVVGPEFGPIAGFCVAVVQRQRPLALRSLLALAVGFPVAIAAALLATLVFKWTGAAPETFTAADHSLSNVIASPDFFTFFVAFCAGVAGMLSLTSAKSGALIGVLISVTTIPAVANIGLSAAYGDWSSSRGSLEQLAINLAMLLTAGVLTLTLQKVVYHRRRSAHMHDAARGAAGLPMDRGSGYGPSESPAPARRRAGGTGR